MKCPKCKKEIPDSSDFCIRCGTYINPAIIPINFHIKVIAVFYLFVVTLYIIYTKFKISIHDFVDKYIR